MEPAGVSFVIPITLCDSHTSQRHQGPLDSSQIFACRHATSLHQQRPRKYKEENLCCIFPLNCYSKEKLLLVGYLTLKEVYSLKYVSFGDSVTFSCSEEHGDLLHLFECHARALDGLDWLVGSTQAVDELTQHLDAHGVLSIHCT